MRQGNHALELSRKFLTDKRPVVWRCGLDARNAVVVVETDLVHPRQPDASALHKGQRVRLGKLGVDQRCSDLHFRIVVPKLLGARHVALVCRVAENVNVARALPNQARLDFQRRGAGCTMDASQIFSFFPNVPSVLIFDGRQAGDATIKPTLAVLRESLVVGMLAAGGAIGNAGVGSIDQRHLGGHRRGRAARVPNNRSRHQAATPPVRTIKCSR